jgi:hypothetical protein
MELFPSYLNRKPESVKGTGNAVIPALVTWKIDTETTEKLEWMENSTLPFRETKMSLHYLKISVKIQIIKLLHRIIGLKTMKIKLPTVGKDQYPLSR